MVASVANWSADNICFVFKLQAILADRRFQVDLHNNSHACKEIVPTYMQRTAGTMYTDKMLLVTMTFGSMQTKEAA